MKRKSYIVLASILMPLVVLAITGQSKARAFAKDPQARVTGVHVDANGYLTVGTKTYHLTHWSKAPGGDWIGTVDSTGSGSSSWSSEFGRPTTQYVAVDSSNNTISPVNTDPIGRWMNGKGAARAYADACKNTNAWDACSATCDGTGGWCDTSSNPSCQMGGANHTTCVSYCNELVTAASSNCTSDATGGIGLDE